VKKHLPTPAAFAVLFLAAVFAALSLGSGKGQQPVEVDDARLPGPERDALQMIEEGCQTFRIETS